MFTNCQATIPSNLYPAWKKKSTEDLDPSMKHIALTGSRSRQIRSIEDCVCVCVCVCVVCVCVCVCVCVHVYVVYEDTNLYNDIGMT